MDKIKLSEIDKSYIINFLKCDDGNIDKEREKFMVGLNIVVFSIAAYFFASIAMWIVIMAINIILLVLIINFLKNVEINGRNFFLYHGIYNAFLIVGSALLSCALLRVEFGKDNFLIIPGLIICSTLFGVLNFIAYIRKIKKNCYQYGIKRSVLGPLAFAGIVIAFRPLYTVISVYLLMGIACGIVAIIMGGNSVYFFVKAYCYSLVDEKDVTRSIKKIQNENALFNRYGKK